MTLPYERLVSRPYLITLRTLKGQGPHRFNDLKRSTELGPKTLDRVLKALTKDLFVYKRPLPSKTKRHILEYRIAPRGNALLEAQASAVRTARKHRHILGENLMAQMEVSA